MTEKGDCSHEEAGARTLHFTSRTEIVTRERFNPARLVTEENYVRIISDYNLPELDWMACQLRRKREPCNHAHGYGWLVCTTGGDEACIGGDCADKYFGARSGFARDRARAKRELTIDDLRRRISLAQSSDDIPRRVDQVLAAADRLYQQTRTLIDALPAEVVSAIRDMAKAGRRAAVMVLVEYPEKPDDEKPYEKPRARLQPYSIGDVRGVRALDTPAIKALSVAARAVKVAWSDRQAFEEASLRKLRELANTLEGLGQIEGQAEAAADTWDSFREPANLERCAFLTRNDEAQRGVFELARSGSSRKAAREAWRATVKHIESQNGGRSFRIP